MCDIIYIEADSGAVKRQGRSDAYATEIDLAAKEYVALPKRDVYKKKEILFRSWRSTLTQDIMEVTSLFLDAKSSAKYQ